MPAVLLDAARLLFAQGFPDPRDCEYRAIELEVGSIRPRDGGLVATRGFLLPGKSHAIAWNGLVYPVHSVGVHVDLAADVAALLAKPPAPARKSPAIEERESVSLAARLPAVLLLARRGESAAAADLWHATGFDLAGEPDPYDALATEWVWRLYDRATTAHLRGAHPLALESLRVLATVQPLVEAAAAQRRIARRDRKHPYLDFLEPVPVLLADEQRRATRGPRLPLPDGPAMAKLSEDQRVALLVDHLDEVVAPDSLIAGNVDPKRDPIVEALIDLGAPAVEPLIEVVASDQRLTRSIHYRRKVAHERLPLAVYEAPYAAWKRSSRPRSSTAVRYGTTTRSRSGPRARPSLPRCGSTGSSGSPCRSRSAGIASSRTTAPGLMPGSTPRR